VRIYRITVKKEEKKRKEILIEDEKGKIKT
jgi:hypothetical protein